MQELPELVIHWDITKVCNYKCSYCFDTEKKIDNYPDQRILLNKILKILKGSWEFQIGGTGEPFLTPNFLEIVRKIIKSGHTIVVVTNFSLPVERFLEFCKITEGKLASFNASLHLEEANLDEFLEKAIKINKIIKNKFVVSSVARKGQVEELEKIGKRFTQEGIKFVMRLERKGKLEDPFIEYIEPELEIIKKFSGVLADKNNLKCKGKLCWAGSRYLVINEIGEAWRCYPARKFKYEQSLGNLLQETFKLNETPSVCPYEYCTCATPVIKGMILSEKESY